MTKIIKQIEQEEELKKLYYQYPQLTYEVIARKLHRYSESKVQRAVNYCVKNKGWIPRNSRKENNYIHMSDEELIELIRQQPSRDKAGNKVLYAVKKRFGSWSEGRVLAGIGLSSGGILDPNMPTNVYLIDFGKYIKIGITQQEVNKRIERWDAELIETVQCSYDRALEIEKQVKNNLKRYKFDNIPENLRRNGYTECYYKNSAYEMYPSLESLLNG